MSDQSESTTTVPELGCDALFSPFPPKPENVEYGKFYVWARNGNLQVMKAIPGIPWEEGLENEPGLEDMTNDFPDREFWPFADDLIGSLYGPISFSENAEPSNPLTGTDERQNP